MKLARTALRIPYRGYKSHVAPRLAPLDLYAGAYLYGNLGGLHRNVTGSLAERRSRLRTDGEMSEPARRSDARKLRDKGYLELGTPFDDDLVETIRHRYEELIERDDHTEPLHHDDPGDGNVYRRALNDPVGDIPEITELLTDDVRSILRSYYGAPFQVLIVNAYRTEHVPPDLMERKDVFSNHWHVDGKSTDHMKLFVCLSETNDEDGPLHVLPKPDNRKIARSNPRLDRYGDGKPGGRVDQIGDPVTLTGGLGTAMLANSQLCLHRAGIPDEGRTRDLLQFYMAPATEPWPETWDSDDLGNTYSGGLRRLVKY